MDPAGEAASKPPRTSASAIPSSDVITTKPTMKRLLIVER